MNEKNHILKNQQQKRSDPESLEKLRKTYTRGAVPKVIRGKGSELLLTYTLAKAQVTPNTTSPLAPIAPDESEPTRTAWLTIATEDPDRAGDIMNVEGCESENFFRNPQFLWQHGLTDEPVNTIGRILELRAENGVLYALAEYAPAEVSNLAERIYQLDSAGFLPANSIGFHPLEWEANEFGGNTFRKWELIECSKVELPMNPNAVDEEENESNSASSLFLQLEDAQAWLRD